MPARVRKLIGTIALLVLIAVYSLVVMRLGADLMEGTNILVQTVFWIVAGIAWVPAAGYLVRWMARPDQAAD